MENNKEISVPKTGMNLDGSPHELKEQEYKYSMGSILEDRDGNGLNLQNEPSNILCTLFKPGFKVIGFKLDLNTNRTYFFLVNPTTNTSEIGYIDNIHNISMVEDTESECKCTYKNILAEPLEGQTQTPTCVYNTLINDDCNKCLNFNIKYPIQDIVLKDEKSGKKLYFTDNLNPPRYLDLNDISKYYYNEADCGEEPTQNCNDDLNCDCEECEENTCPNCEKLNIFKSFEKPCLKPRTIVNGGNLKRGVYQFLIAYCDEFGTELSEYYSLTNPVRVFDIDDNILDQTQLANETNYAIKLEALLLDKSYTHYKIVVVQAATVSGDLAYFVEGLHSTSDTSIIYTTENNKERTTLELINAVKPTYLKSKGMTSSGGYLYQYGLTAPETINLQPIVILMSPFLKWVAGVAKEDLYKDGVNDALYGGYARGENIPFAIKFFDSKGNYTNNFILTHRPPTEFEEEIVYTGEPEDNDDVKSVMAYIKDCEISERTKRWQFYNTATEDELQPCQDFNSAEDFIEYIDDVQFTCENIIPNIYLNGEYTAKIPKNYTSLKNFIQDYQNQITDSSSEFYDEDLTDMLNDSYELSTCEPTISGDCEAPIFLSSKNYVEDITNELKIINYKESSDYTPSSGISSCNIYKKDNSGNINLDTTFITNFSNNQTPPASYTDVYERNIQTTILNCSTPKTIGVAIDGEYLDYMGSNNVADLKQTKNAATSGVSGGFTSKIHQKALWFKFNFKGEQKGIIEIFRTSSCTQNELFNNSQIRVSTFLNCAATDAVQSFIVDLTSNIFIDLDVSNYSNQNEILVVIDAPIKTATYSTLPNTRYYIEPPCGCFSVLQRDVEILNTTFSWDSITIKKVSTYTSECTFKLPVAKDCGVVPYKEGKFGYWESRRNYPCNTELYSASGYNINSSDIPSEIREDFENYFVTSTDGSGNYTLNTNVNLTEKPIRHYKMPPNSLIPFMSELNLPDFQETVIFPLGVKIDNEVVNAFLDIAVKNNLITQNQRDNIVGYEILRGDRTLDKSILHKGLIYDMTSYEDAEGKNIHYSNYPYNALGKDCNHYNLNTNRTDNDLIVFTKDFNSKYTYHSPDVHFNNPKPPTPTEIEFEGYQYGKSRGKFTEIENHPKYVILDDNAYLIANTLAIAESALELAILLGQAYLSYTESFRIAPVTGDNNIAGTLWATAATATMVIAQAGANSVFNTGRRRYEWLEAFKNNGKPKNFAYKYASEGWYNSLKFDHTEGNILRGLSAAKYLKGGGSYSVSEKKIAQTTYINNIDRESSLYLSFGQYLLNYSNTYKNWDNYDVDRHSSSRYRNSDKDCRTGEDISNIASPYISLKQYLPEQYGDVNDVRWINTGYCGRLDRVNTCDMIFGGDIRISRFSLKRKIPHFLVNAIGQADYTPFAYSLYNNIGEVKNYANFDIELSNTSLISGLFDSIFPDVGSEYDFDCKTSFKNFYLTNPSKFSLFSYGIPQFLTESEINVNYRYAGKEQKEWFFPNGGNANDYDKWTQEINVPIRFDNDYKYNSVYSRNIIFDKGQLLPTNYKREDWAKKSDFKNAVIVSEADSTETNSNDPWLNYKPFNLYEFPSESGLLISLSDIESRQMIARFTNGFSLLNSIDVIRERLAPNNRYLGLGVFEQRPLEFKRTQLGYGGTQHKFLVSCEFGHFWVDARRGQIMKVDSNGQNPLEISAFKRDGSPSGMRNWFKENLPFKILRGVSGLKDTEIDNNFNSIGLTGVWDSRLRRFVLTKKDYTTKEQYLNQIYSVNGTPFININNNPVELSFTNTTYFEDVSFTISYSPIYDSWSSFHPYKPDYYIGYNNYFQSGYNNPTASLWSHLLTNKSFQVFNGIKTPWIIEVINKDRYTNKINQSFEYWLDSRRYHNEWDFAEKTDLGFNKAWVYNNSGNSGELKLINTIKNNRFQLTQYPKINNNVFEILQTPFDKKFTFNDFYNRINNELSNIPIWLNDKNNLKQSLNNKAFNFTNKKMDRLRGDWSIVRLQQDEETRFKMIFKWANNKNNIYQ